MSYKIEYVLNKLKSGHVRFDICQTSENSAALVLPGHIRTISPADIDYGTVGQSLKKNRCTCNS